MVANGVLAYPTIYARGSTVPGTIEPDQGPAFCLAKEKKTLYPAGLPARP
jgi:hypothetical protein